MATKRVLIITYYWPPYTGSGVQRWLKFAKYLPEFGWQPVIYTPENPDYGLKDNSFLQEISDSCEELKYPIWEPYQLLQFFKGKSKQSNIGLVKSNQSKSFKDKVLNWIRGNLFIPDPRIFWVKPSIRFLKKYLKDNPVDIIITTGPPHSMHLIGLGLKQQLGLKWIADFRDPWSKLDFLDQFLVTSWSRKRYESMERRVLKYSDLVIGTSWSMQDFLQNFDASKYHTITNGFDTTDFEKPNSTPIDQFIISHTGLLNENRNPKFLWKALNEFCKTNSSFDQVLQIQLTGLVAGSIIQEIESYPYLKSKLDLKGYQDHQTVIKQNAKAAVLLMLINNTHNANANIPGKLFEYLAVKRPILSIGKKEADASKIVAETNAGLTIEYDNEEGIKRAIQQLFSDFTYKKETVLEDHQIKQFSRKELTKHLVSLLDETINLRT